MHRGAVAPVRSTWHVRVTPAKVDTTVAMFVPLNVTTAWPVTDTEGSTPSVVAVVASAVIDPELGHRVSPVVGNTTFEVVLLRSTVERVPTEPPVDVITS